MKKNYSPRDLSVNLSDYAYTKFKGYRVYEAELGERVFPAGWKVVRHDLTSTGMNGTPVVQYSDEHWVSQEHGIHSARVPSYAAYVQWVGSVRENNPLKRTRVFFTALDDLISVGKNSVKSKAILLLEEI